MFVLLTMFGCAVGEADVEQPGSDTSYLDAEADAKVSRACFDSLELPQSRGECTTNADCATGGCWGEVCTTAEAAPTIITPCVSSACLEEVTRCGCHRGMCTWVTPR
jgi:eight-cysteine-cluster-containing protein